VTDGVVRRLPVKFANGSIDLIEIDGIFYLEAQGENTLIRTKRKKPYKSVQRICELAKKAPSTGVCALPQRIHCQSKSRALPHPAQIPRLRPPPRTVFASVTSPRQVLPSTAASPSPATALKKFVKSSGYDCRRIKPYV